MIRFESIDALAFIIFTVLIILDALSDSVVYKERNKTATDLQSVLKHIFQALTILLMFVFLLFSIESISNFLWYLLSYILLRFSIFDLIYNISIKQHPMYVGHTSIYDKILKKFMSHANSVFVLYALKSVSLICSLAIIQNI